METVDSLNGFLSVVKNLRSRCASIWYRGIEGSAFSVQPGLYWRRIGAEESSLVAEFISMAPQYTPNREDLPLLNDNAADWQWYFLMQHFGMPTRLLDWTENPLVALYFAVREFGSPSPPTTVPRVWVMNPTALNRQSVGENSILIPGGSLTQHWLFRLGDVHEGPRCLPGTRHKFSYGEKGTLTNEDPLAIYPVRRNHRLVAQLGVFTVHGAKPRGLEKVLGMADRPDDVGTKMFAINILRSRAVAILEDLEDLGIHELALFPELSRLAEHIKRAKGVDDSVGQREVKRAGNRKVAKRKVAKRVRRKVAAKIVRRKMAKKVRRKAAKR